MASANRGVVFQQIDRLYREGTLSGLGDGQLLERYLTRGDEAAFEALVDLHGPMVLGLCRRVLRDPRDIEDAFQATFLILVRKASTIRDRVFCPTGFTAWLTESRGEPGPIRSVGGAERSLSRTWRPRQPLRPLTSWGSDRCSIRS